MLLPAAERRGEIHFLVAKSLSYSWRLGLAFVLMAVGLVLQVILIESAFWIGLPVVLLGVSLLLTKGFENVVREKGVSAEWRPAGRAEAERILDINKKQKAWDQDVVDITNTSGCLVLAGLVVAALLTIIGLAHIGAALPSRVALLVVANMAAMLVPFWLTGTRNILKNDQLVIKADLLVKVEDALRRAGAAEGEEFQYQVQTADTQDGKGQVPHDVKALLSFHGASPDFLGLQMQVSINSVQGKDYPYFYCVLVAREAFGSMERAHLDPPPEDVVIEPAYEDGVYIVVIRRHTTKKSGFHTKQPFANGIFVYALAQARRLLEERSTTS